MKIAFESYEKVKHLKTLLDENVSYLFQKRTYIITVFETLHWKWYRIISHLKLIGPLLPVRRNSRSDPKL